MFLISDDYADFKDIINYNKLKEFYINALKQDALDNREDYDVLKSCLDEFEKLTKDDFISVDYLKDALQGYGYYVQDLSKMQRDINNLRQAIAYIQKDENENIKALDKILEILDKGVV